jgi:hypothetical protein
MADRVSLSGRQLGLLEIAAHHQDLQLSLTLYFSEFSPAFPVRFEGYLKAEVIDELGERLEETDLSSSLLILASVEAAFRIDYLQRCYRRDKSPISRHFSCYLQKEAASCFFGRGHIRGLGGSAWARALTDWRTSRRLSLSTLACAWALLDAKARTALQLR